jgi:predicted dehydrogenase
MRFAVIGFGYWGRNYVRLLQRHPDTQLTVIADASTRALAEARAAAAGARMSPSPLEAIASDDVDAVVIATPATTHFRLAQAALQAGKAVLCEKPLSTTVDECEELIRVADIVGKPLFVGHTFLYSPAIQTAKRLLLEHELGGSVHAHAAWTAPGPVRRDVNALWDLAPHPLSILTYLLERSPTSVAATGQAILAGSREDVVFMHLRFDDLATADVHLSWLAPRKTRMLTLTGDRRLVVFDDAASHAKLQIYDTSAVNDGCTVDGSDPRSLFLPEEPELVYVPTNDAAEPLAQQLDHFIDSSRARSEYRQHALAGLDVVRVLEAAQASLADDGRPVAPALATAT